MASEQPLPSFTPAAIVEFMHRIAALALLLAASDPLEEVREVGRRVIAADNAGDVRAMEALYSDNTMWLPLPSGEPVLGRAAILKRYAQIFRDSKLELQLRSERTELWGDRAVDYGATTGRSISKSTGAVTEISDRYAMTFERGPDRRWRVHTLAWWPKS